MMHHLLLAQDYLNSFSIFSPERFGQIYKDIPLGDKGN